MKHSVERPRKRHKNVKYRFIPTTVVEYLHGEKGGKRETCRSKTST